MLPLISEREPAAPLPAPQRPLTQQGVRRTFMPGSESLYAKLYTGNATADRVLTQVLERTPCRALADGWFFGRFDDPYHHLRLRFRGDPAPLSEQLWPALRDACAPLLVDGLLSRVVFDTYERETECYGGPQAIEIAEQIFQADSEATIELVAMLEPGAAGDRERWLLAACGAQMLLRDLGLDAGQRLALLTQLRDSTAASIAPTPSWVARSASGCATSARRSRPCWTQRRRETEPGFRPARTCCCADPSGSRRWSRTSTRSKHATCCRFRARSSPPATSTCPTSGCCAWLTAARSW
ncbi:MAG: thiopeptide-type bacteriocin biosynthesis protein [Solirubrobacterales bacterium]|nr:thiopeptide-type bacteriocin biosynthesis protein [Solirubrobacterales bacterium]